ncbi:hypothetical protein QJS10_CPB22g01114 [Acorus calamus]|uniref:Uncharacterized protein n=1 Tax=Acorus calamus TaxID=4465 RepID=A0AAV9C0M9_ACOCL|nr:hypothetical protein QJS10_CPB22g01114 [Acorus calamus]
MGSYARFLWDAETVEEEKEENEFDKEYSCSSNSKPPFFHGTSYPSPIAATS